MRKTIKSKKGAVIDTLNIFMPMIFYMFVVVAFLILMFFYFEVNDKIPDTMKADSKNIKGVDFREGSVDIKGLLLHSILSAQFKHKEIDNYYLSLYEIYYYGLDNDKEYKSVLDKYFEEINLKFTRIEISTSYIDDCVRKSKIKPTTAVFVEIPKGKCIYVWTKSLI
jgi:hypothetical protein